MWTKLGVGAQHVGGSDACGGGGLSMWTKLGVASTPVVKLIVSLLICTCVDHSFFEHAMNPILFEMALRPTS